MTRQPLKDEAPSQSTSRTSINSSQDSDSSSETDVSNAQQATPQESGSTRNDTQTFAFTFPFHFPRFFPHATKRKAKTSVDPEVLMDTLHMTVSEAANEFATKNSQYNGHVAAIRGSIVGPLHSLSFGHKYQDPFETLRGDVVILGGYRGSILRDSQTGRRVWFPIRVGLGLRSVNLELGLNDEDEAKATQQIYADGMIDRVGPVDVAHRLQKIIGRNPNVRLHSFAYDWRLSLDVLSQQLSDFIAKLESKPLVIAHSMGGLIAHHAICRQPTIAWGVIYAGSPFGSCPNILGPFKNGDEVLFSKEVLTPMATFSMRSSFAFLPQDGLCYNDRKSGDQLKIDFFDPEEWYKYHLSPVLDPHAHIIDQKDFGALPKMDPAGRKRGKVTYVAHETIKEYLGRTLKRTKKFLEELNYEEDKSYPPMAVIYNKDIRTVRGAWVNGVDGVKQGRLNDLVLGHGDGVVLAVFAQLPHGFKPVKRVLSHREHVSLLSDIDAVGEALEGILGLCKPDPNNVSIETLHPSIKEGTQHPPNQRKSKPLSNAWEKLRRTVVS